MVLALGPLRGAPTTPPRASASGSRPCTAGRRARRPDRRRLRRARRLERAEGRDAALVPLVGRLLPGAATRRHASSPSRSATSATARTGRCCARWPRACRSSSCCCRRAGTRTSARATPTSGLPRARRASSGSAAARDEEAARLIACADVGIVPFERSEFNDAGAALPDPQVRARSGGARSRRRSPACARGTQAVTWPTTPQALDRRAARASGRAYAPGHRAARLGARADRAAPERAAVGAPRGARDRRRVNAAVAALFEVHGVAVG